MDTFTKNEHHISSAGLSSSFWQEKIHNQNLILQQKELECLQDILQANQSDGRCPRIWDGILCWPPAPPSSEQQLQCPQYIAGFNINEMASRRCTENGSWYFNDQLNRTWTNYSLCIASDTFNEHNSTLIGEWFPVIKKISRVGYGVSLATLVVSFCILASFKKLRCPRNTLHMHLFVSFIMRAFMTLLKDNILTDGIGISSQTLFHHDQVLYHGGHWLCKLVSSLWQYFIMANYSWILMEGLYLHNLIFLALFTDSSAITVYVYLGWGLPLLFVSPWVVLRALFEDLLCWTTNENVYIFWLIRGPITISIIVNFVFFVHVTWAILLKLRSGVSAETRKYRKWAKSTLVLVPLFGVHYTIFGGMQGAIGRHETVEIIWLFCDQLFACFQGFFVAVLYCLLNGEVRGEISRRWKHFKQAQRQGYRWQCQINNSRSNLSRWRTSVQSLGASAERRDARPGSLTPSPVGGSSLNHLNRLVPPLAGNLRNSSKNSSFESRLEKIVSESEEVEVETAGIGKSSRNQDGARELPAEAGVPLDVELILISASNVDDRKLTDLSDSF